jgi:hypothetical protein
MTSSFSAIDRPRPRAAGIALAIGAALATNAARADHWPGRRPSRRDSDALVLLDVLARQVGVRGVFSDWPATVTYYANCFGL